jgi:hypothetical protein
MSDVFKGMSLERLAELAEKFGIDGPADGLVTFARAIRFAALAVDGRPVLTPVHKDSK